MGSVEVVEAVTVSFLQFCSNNTTENKAVISEIFFIYDYLAKERLLTKININRIAYFTLFNNHLLKQGFMMICIY